MRIKQIAYHRNGISGMGFDAVLFTTKETGLAVGVVFPERGAVAVLSVAGLSDPKVGVEFGKNSWRGDHYEADLRLAIRKHDRKVYGITD